jgi:hypothetical protein
VDAIGRKGIAREQCTMIWKSPTCGGEREDCVFVWAVYIIEMESRRGMGSH